MLDRLEAGFGYLFNALNARVGVKNLRFLKPGRPSKIDGKDTVYHRVAPVAVRPFLHHVKHTSLLQLLVIENLLTFVLLWQRLPTDAWMPLVLGFMC